MESRRTELLSAAALVLVAFLFGTSFVVVKGALDDVDPVPFLALRASFATLALVPFAVRRPGRPGELRAATLTGLMYLAGMLSQTIGLQYTTAATSAFLTYLLIVIVPFVSFAIGRGRPSRLTVVAIGIALVGLALLTGAGDGFGRGAVFTLIGAVAFAIHLVQMGEYGPRFDIFRFNALQMAAVALPCIVLVPFTGGLPTAGSAYAVAFYAGVVVSAFALVPWTWAQRHIPPTRASLILLTEPVFATIAAYIVDDERFTAGAALGALLILAAAVLAEVGPVLTARSGLDSPGPMAARATRGD
ncbi:MAG TPA: DMT family transporter [Acidimicrobiales bacterium]|nr:DMT family transporter [Acidimicrobiales bacterium]